MIRVGYFLMLIAVIVFMGAIVYITGGAFGAIIGVGFLGYLVYLNNKGGLE